jgi:hypothetical protein
MYITSFNLLFTITLLGFNIVPLFFWTFCVKHEIVEWHTKLYPFYDRRSVWWLIVCYIDVNGTTDT